MGPFRFEPLRPQHERRDFSCGDEDLDRWLKTQATQEARRRVANTFVALAAAGDRIAGFYCLSSAVIPTRELPPDLARRLPRYPTLPAVRVGRLAVDLAFQGRGLGAALLADAAGRVLDAPAAVYALLVEAKHEQAAGFYRRYGFIPLLSSPLAWFLPLATLAKARS
jgi:GNAT superfamily N-acetyltransferase